MSEVDAGSLAQTLSYFIETEFLIWLIWKTNLLWDVYHLSIDEIISQPSWLLDFYMGSEDVVSGPHGHKLSALSIEPSFNPNLFAIMCILA